MISKKSIDSGTFTQDEKKFILEKLNHIGAAPMTASAHGYKEGQAQTVLSASEESAQRYDTKSKNSPAVAIMSVVLAANRNYNRAVGKHVEGLWKNYGDLTLKGLSRLIENNDSAEKFRNIWGHNDEKKFQVLKDILALFLPELKDIDTPQNDFNVLAQWAENASLLNDDDPVLKIRNVGIATFQHLRMTFGVDTVKPDQRVKEVLEREFGLKLSDKKSILALERIASVAGSTNLLIDQIFVKYGSGHYYSQNDPNLT